MYHPFPLGGQRTDTAAGGRGQMCQKGAACVSECELGHQTDSVATHHDDRVTESCHARCLLGCATDSQKQGIVSVNERISSFTSLGLLIADVFDLSVWEVAITD